MPPPVPLSLLPIDDALPALRDALRRRAGAVLQAPPGAGKTTRVPLALLDEPWLDGAKIVMLEPRRLAARAAAGRMAATLREPVGATVGYRVRLDTRVGPRTRVEVVTEGVLTRMLQRDAALEGVGLVIFDEFHERSLHADLGLALTLHTQQLLRDELRVLVMSATLDGGGARVAELLGRATGGAAAPVVTSEGRSYPVAVRYLDRRPEPGPGPGGVEAAVVAAVRDAIRFGDGNVLAFLPGAGEIRRVAGLLARAPADGGLPAEARVRPLYGDLSQEEQDLAIAPSRPGERKVVLATSIAETSLTIDGVRVVVDSGLARAPRFSPRAGMARLETARVSRASADQRCGRAGRLGPGACVRLWPEHEQAHLLPHAPPEIAAADLAPLALELAVAGVNDPSELLWLDPPPAAAFAAARRLLASLGAAHDPPNDDMSNDVTRGSTPNGIVGRATAHGRAMAELPLHPRLAHMALRGAALGLGAAACDLAALLGERDVLRGEGGPPDADLRLRVEVLRAAGSGDALAAAHGARVDRDALRRARQAAGALRAALRVESEKASAQKGAQTSAQPTGRRGDRGPPPENNILGDGGPARTIPSRPQPFQRARPAPAPPRDGADPLGATGMLLALAYPDRVAQRRPGPDARYLLRSGQGAVFAEGEALGVAPYVVAAELGGLGQEPRITLAAAVDRDEVEAEFGDQIERAEEVWWDGEAGAVRARSVHRLGALVLREGPLPQADPAHTLRVILDAVRAEGLGILSTDPEDARTLDRVRFAATLETGWPDASDDALLRSLDDWLAPYLGGVRRRDELARLRPGELLLTGLDPRRRARLDALAPTHVAVPSGSRLRVDYSDPGAPALAVRLQEMFGAAETPRVGDGRVALTLRLLSPAHRPVQVTRDLAGFWRTSYFDVRKDLRGRYPKHHWPDDPLAAPPTARAKSYRRE